MKKTLSLQTQIQKKIKDEIKNNGFTNRLNLLNTLNVMIKEADDSSVHDIYYNTSQSIVSIIICDIPSLTLKYGTNYDRDGIQSKLRGLAENCKDDNGDYIVSVATTHDLNTAIIKDVNKLLKII